MVILNTIVVMFFIGVLLFVPQIVDDIHMEDTVLLGNIAWRGLNGYFPVIDYPHFYGGITELAITVAFYLFGTSYKSIDYGFILLFFFACLATWTLCWKRLSYNYITLLTALAAALLISLDPLEVVQVFHIGHSFSYNHLAVVLMLSLIVFACSAHDESQREFITAFLAGVILYVLILIKTTFGLIGPSIIFVCLLQRRWTSALLIMAGVTTAMLFLDPGMPRALGSLSFLLKSDAAAEAGGFWGALKVTLQMLRGQVVPIGVTLILAMTLWRRQRSNAVSLIVSIAVCGLGYGLCMLTTGGSPEKKLLPFVVVASSLLVSALARADPQKREVLKYLKLATFTPVLFAYLLIVPAMASSLQLVLHADKNKDARLVEEGPLSDYVVIDPEDTNHKTRFMSVASRLSDARLHSLDRVRTGALVERDKYVMFADGIEMLQGIPHISGYGIISNGRMFDFTMPLKSKVVLSYPVWPTLSSVKRTRNSPLESDVDMVMISDEVPALRLVTDPLRARMGQDFQQCRRSAYWTLFARRTLPKDACDSSV